MSGARRERERPTPVPDSRPSRVLIVDDQEMMRLVMRSFLEKDGYVVIEATDGQAAIDRMGEADVVVMDVLMPGVDGITACRQIRELDRGLPVVLVTATTDRQARIDGKAAGADDFLTKPIDAAELCARVGVLARAKALAAQVAIERGRLQAELLVAQDAVAYLERLATLGTLAAGVGHELKNLANVVLGVGDDLRQDEPGARELGAPVLERVGRHLAFLGQNLMRLGNRSEASEEPVDAVQVARQVRELMRRAGRLSGTTVTLDVSACPPVRANALELEQVLINLIGNAVDAVDGCARREVAITVGPGPLGVRLVVRDSGVGMAPEVLERVFEPYFTTKVDGRGTGLGLPVVQQRVLAWDGAIHLDSAPGAGTSAVVDLVAAERG